MEIDILTGSILIGLFLTNVILIFLDSRQRSTFRQTEKHLQDALRQTESRLQAATAQLSSSDRESTPRRTARKD